MNAFTLGYLEAALWSTNDESTPQGGEPLEKNYSVDDFSPETLAQALEDCDKFQEAHAADIVGRLEDAGADFWLTRNGHGAGFWDGDWGELGDKLTQTAEQFGEICLYVGDDGLIYN